MTPSPAAAVKSFRRRVAAGVLVEALAAGLGVGALAVVALGLGLRLAGHGLTPSPWWSLAALPIVAFAVWRLRRERLAPAVAAAHLDHRLGLGGLLCAAYDDATLEPAWAAHLGRGLAPLAAALPRVRWRKVLPWPSLSAALAVGVLLLPPPPLPPEAIAASARLAELEQAAVAMRELFARGQLPDEVKQELEQQLAALQKDAAAGKPPAWRDLDQLDQRIEREALLAAARESAAAVAGTPGAAAAGAPDPSKLVAAAKALAAAGLLDQLPAATREVLEQSRRADGAFDAAGLPTDPKALQALAEALGGLAGKLGQAGQPGQVGAALTPGQLKDLQQVLEQFGHQPGGGLPQADGVEEQDGVGRGGIDRGPGHAALTMTEDAAGKAGSALPLPPGHALPGDWVPLGERRSEPQVAPTGNTGAGGDAVGGPAGATWQLDLAPHHRAVLRRFFGEAQTPPRKEPR